MNKQKKHRTDFLFSTSSFSIGIGSIFNLAGNYYTFNYSDTGLEADMKALASDWFVIGQDIEDAINGIESKTNKNQLELELNE